MGRLFLSMLLTLSITHTRGFATDLGLEVPEGFEVTLFAGDSLAHDIYSITVDANGRVVVAGRDYIKTLHDDDGDGVADRAVLFSDKPASGAHGLCADGNALLCTGDDGLWRLEDSDGDGRADASVRWTQLHHPEHGGNGIVQGPDGWFYVICGNDAGVNETHASLPGSPVTKPVCGAVVRISPDGKSLQVMAHGFRNPYDLAFDRFGRSFTVDADGERDHHLPWYSGTRLFDIAQGMEHGWLLRGWQRSWNRPEWFYDNVDRLVEIGRGSPTGVEVYSHNRFPERFRNGVFSCCWTFGRVYFLELAPKGSSYQGEMEIFLKTTGDRGFAPVDIAVGKEGELFVAIGGRGTLGSVFRVRYTGQLEVSAEPANDLQRVLSAPQPLSAWSRAHWKPLAIQLGKQAFLDALVDKSLSVDQRIRAVEILTELFDGQNLAAANEVLAERESMLGSRVLWGLSHSSQQAAARELFAKATHFLDPNIQREAWEAIARFPEPIGEVTLDWREAMLSKDRRVRWAMILAARGPAHANFEEHCRQKIADNPSELSTERLAKLWVDPPPAEPDALRQYFDDCLAFFVRDEGVLGKLEAVRLIQRGLGDILLSQDGPEHYPGYVAASLDQLDERTRRVVAGVLSISFPSKNEILDREMARTFGMLQGQHSKLIPAIASLWTPKSSPADDVHFLITSSRLPGPRGPETTQKTASMLVGLFEKMNKEQLYPSRNFGARVNEAATALMKRDGNLAAELVANPGFGQPDHVGYLSLLKGDLRRDAIRKLVQHAKADDESWTPELFAALTELDASEALPLLRQHVETPAYRDDCLRGLAHFHAAEDRAVLVAGLASVRPDVLLAVATALKAGEQKPTVHELALAMQALRKCCYFKEQKAERDAIVALLRHWTGEKPVERSADEQPMAIYDTWFAWFQATHPEPAAKLLASQVSTGKDLLARLEKIDWKSADPIRGQVVFEKKACHLCHIGARRLGPSLAKITEKLSREDLFVAIVDPSRVTSPLYQTTSIATVHGMVYNGILIYESPESTMLQTGPDTTVRVFGPDVLAQRQGTQSLMPNGLLDGMDDGQWADLYRYLQTLRE